MIRLTRSAVVDAPVEQVWPIMRDFGGWASWHPALASCSLESGLPDEVGAVRLLRLDTGEQLREQLIAQSDRDKSSTWCLVEASMPLDGYVATVRLRPVTHDHRSLVEWRVQADGPTSARAAAEQLFGDRLIGTGLAGLARAFTSLSRSSRVPLHPSTAEMSDRQARGREPLDHSSYGAPADSRPRRNAVSFANGEGKRFEGLLTGEIMETRAIVVERHGGPEVLVSTHISVPPPGPGEVRLRHTAIGVNMIDVHGRAGDFGLGALPAVPGMEAAGVVLEVGPGDTNLRPGDRVVYAGRPPGSYAEARTIPADMVVPLPPDIDDMAAAASFLKGITADLLLHDVHPLRAGELVLVHAAAGGLGLLLCGWARALGATVVGVVSREPKMHAAASVCDAVIVSSREDVARTVRELTRDRGVDVVFDAIGQATFEASLASLAPRGHLVSFGQVSGPVGARDIDALAARSIRLSRPNFADYTDAPDALAMRAGRLFAALRAGHVRPRIDSRWPLDQAAEAHRRLESRETIGSVLLFPGPG